MGIICKYTIYRVVILFKGDAAPQTMMPTNLPVTPCDIKKATMRLNDEGYWVMTLVLADRIILGDRKLMYIKLRPRRLVEERKNP